MYYSTNFGFKVVRDIGEAVRDHPCTQPEGGSRAVGGENDRVALGDVDAEAVEGIWEDGDAVNFDEREPGYMSVSRGLC